MDKLKKPKIQVFVFFLCIAAILRVYSLSRFYLMDGDSAVFGLMAKHVYSLSEFPAYMWLNHYAGALVSYIGAVLFAIFGVSAWSYCLAGALLSVCWALATMGIARKILDLPGFICACCIAAIPPALLLFYSLYPGGVQAETLLFCVIILYILFDYATLEGKDGFGVYLLMGFCCGTGLWLSPGVFPSLLTVLTVFILKDRKIFKSKKIVIFSAGLLAGLLPGIVHNIYNPGATFLRLGGKFLNVTRVSLDGGDPAIVLAQGFLQRAVKIPVSLAQIPALLVKLLGMFNAVLFLIACVVVLTAGYRSFIEKRKINVWFICMIYAVWSVIFYSAAIGMNTPRYLLGLVVIFPFVAGKLLSLICARSKAFFYLILTVMLAGNAFGIVKAWITGDHPRHSDLASWLARNKFYYGYSDYHTAYPVIFHSNERIIVSPTLFNAPFYERYPEYTRRVSESKSAVYVIDMQQYPALAAQTELRFSQLGVRYRKQRFDRFVVYHDLSRDPGPQELNISDPRLIQEAVNGK